MFSAKVLIKSTIYNHPVNPGDFGTVIRTVVREHVDLEDRDKWACSAEWKWNQEHGPHVILSFTGLSRELDPQRAQVEV